MEGGERERGPLEQEVFELIRLKGLSAPALMNAEHSGQMPSVEERMLMAERFGFVLMEAILRVCREIDERPPR